MLQSRVNGMLKRKANCIQEQQTRDQNHCLAEMAFCRCSWASGNGIVIQPTSPNPTPAIIYLAVAR